MQDLEVRGSLRTEARRGAKLLVGIVRPVGEEPDLAVEEEEARRVREVAVGLRKIVFVRPCHQSLIMLLAGNKAFSHP